MEIKKRIGVVTEDLALFEQFKAEEQLYFMGRIYGIDKDLLQSRIDELFDIFELKNQRMKFVYEYSKGMKKKLALMCALIHDPEILFLDEPFEGMDPLSLNLIQENLKLFVKKGGTIFLTSHNLPLIEKLCNEIAIIHNGKLILQSSTRDIRKYLKKQITIDNNSGLEELFLDLVYPERNVKYLSWLL